jgi:diketogulonate reductase-like aldo/keto reductase
MRRRVFGWTGRDVPVIGQGTWYMERDGRQKAVAAIRAGLDAGLTHIDTAEMYGSGRVEEIVGEAIAGRRGEVFLVSKVLPQNAGYQGVLRACEGSLRRLRTDYLDVYLLHWRSRHPLEETIRAFTDLIREGKIRFWGVSNFDVEDLEEALRIAGPRAVACNQVVYHLKERAIEHAVIPWCEKHEVAVVAYSPFGSGDFPTPRSHGGRALEEVAAARKATRRQVALAFLTRRPAVFAIPKASEIDHVRENAGAEGVSLSAEDLRRLDEAFPLGSRPRDLPMI